MSSAQEAMLHKSSNLLLSLQEEFMCKFIGVKETVGAFMPFSLVIKNVSSFPELILRELPLRKPC